MDKISKRIVLEGVGGSEIRGSCDSSVLFLWELFNVLGDVSGDNALIRRDPVLGPAFIDICNRLSDLMHFDEAGVYAQTLCFHLMNPDAIWPD